MFTSKTTQTISSIEEGQVLTQQKREADYLAKGESILLAAKIKSRQNDYAAGREAARLFNAHLNKHATSPGEIKKEQATISYRFRKLMLGGI